MAQHKSSKKRIRQDIKIRLRNRYYKKSARTSIAKLRGMTEKKDAEVFFPFDSRRRGGRCLLGVVVVVVVVVVVAVVAVVVVVGVCVCVCGCVCVCLCVFVSFVRSFVHFRNVFF